uniref:GPI ethanolamine phosphate transferase 1-like isoform X1 n=1 Tax=Vespula vulgaris TaxID=7454 RepID=UPI002124D066|nr:GPI ethanolamine phosphate transferase 1-like isoform X1 [Vespula vulgaris]
MLKFRLFNIFKYIHQNKSGYPYAYNKNSTYLFVLWTLIIHFVFLWGVLDINFHSPIIQGLPVVPGLKNAPAKRLILLVADGLRYRTFRENIPPYLKNITQYKGVWGISHTRVPTESRPGNVAIAAGLYEDPSAIFKGWKENPIDFDSVFNQSRSTWAWGSPDIIPLFTKSNKGNVYGESYPSEWQDFDRLQNDILRLDSWVFDKYLKWLEKKSYTMKHMDGIIFFLHLLGCDTIGHSHKPQSRKYIENMNYIDQRIEEIVQKTEQFFDDRSTAYIFTADHGMTDWGSHGSGSTDETETPLIAWGAGVSSTGIRYDVDQADITPLISTLIGRPIPTNNEGVLRKHYLENNDTYNAQALLNNLKQLSYQVTENRILSCGISDDFIDWRELTLNKHIWEINEYIKNGKMIEGITEAEEAIKLAKEYLYYFKQYQRNYFLMYMTFMWSGWIIFLFLKIVGIPRKKIKPSLLPLVDIIFLSSLIVLIIRYTGNSGYNLRQLSYGLFTVISLWLAGINLIKFVPKLKKQNIKTFLIEIGGTIFLLFIMFMGLTYRAALSAGMLFIVVMQKVIFNKTHNMLLWSGLALAMYPLLPIVEPYPRIYIVSISICIMICKIALRHQLKYKKIIEIVRLIITGLVYLKLIDGRYWISWIILASAPLFIWTYTVNPKDRIEGITIGLFCPLSLLSASYEPFFFLTLAMHLLYWPLSIKDRNKTTDNILSITDFTKASFFMLYTLLCFFGTGNMASISSFDPVWTQHFITVFSPFVMSSLILFKLSIPLILIGCASHILGSRTAFLAVLFLGDCLALPLMYYVNPYGSWLEIGSAISRFTIAITLPCILLILHYFSYPLMKFNLNQFEHLLSEKKHIV